MSAWEKRCTALKVGGKHRCQQGAVPGIFPPLCGTHHRQARKRGLISVTLPERAQMIRAALERLRR